MPEIFEDFEVSTIHHRVPKRRINNKFVRRYRKIYPHQGIISKILMVEGPFSEDDHFEDPKDKLYNKFVKELENDDSGLWNFNIMYSIGKRKRWNVGKNYCDSLPDPMDFSLMSTSIILFEEYQTLHQSLICDLWGTLVTRWGWNPCMRYYGSKETGHSVRNQGKEQENHVGGYSTRFKVVFPIASIKDRPKFHVQYHVREFKLNKKVHNSDKWICYPPHGSGRTRPSLEGCRIGRDVVKIGKEEYETGLYELNGKSDYDVEEYEYEEEIREERSSTFVLGDFMVKRIPQRLRKERQNSNEFHDWELLQNETPDENG